MSGFRNGEGDKNRLAATGRRLQAVNLDELLSELWCTASLRNYRVLPLGLGLVSPT
jgi:hypothetical protein